MLCLPVVTNVGQSVGSHHTNYYLHYLPQHQVKFLIYLQYRQVSVKMETENEPGHFNQETKINIRNEIKIAKQHRNETKQKIVLRHSFA